MKEYFPLNDKLSQYRNRRINMFIDETGYLFAKHLMQQNISIVRAVKAQIDAANVLYFPMSRDAIY